jgi:hypothetical protein
MLTASMSSSISGSASLEPTFLSPALSSSSVTLPSLSVSMSANMSRITSTSSTDRCSAITRMAFFLNLFMAENCCSRARTTSPSGTLGAFRAFCSHGCSAAPTKHQRFGVHEGRTKQATGHT